MFGKTFTRPLTQATIKGSSFYEFVEFIKTPKEMRPYIYRPKNADKLLAMDLKDSDNKPLQSRPPIKKPSRAAFNNLLFQMQSPGELTGLLQEWVDITPRKKVLWAYFHSEHLQNMLIVSTFKLGMYGKLLQKIYELQPNFKQANNGHIYNANNWLTTNLMCRLQINGAKNFKNKFLVKKKVVTLLESTANKHETNGLAKELLMCINKQQDTDISIPTELDKPVNLPSIDVEKSTFGVLAKYITAHRNLYLEARTALEFGSDNDSVKLFVNNYQTILNKLKRPGDIYDESVASLKQLIKPLEKTK
ncbi:mitochondrial 37S ribosomal protein mS44 MRP13 Ecym_2611 [Eremothecium cymbalariae DBVPG|uniref:Uncharacterized protein n=1 Tax=Eremothecium cymbalariae (strain CBS 270.75 / DBVPG 7215 / KCTC 17166 / NRRL Y-17582) TaxID=931890 RepID=G8JQJ1_ERECY|nr:Hypothetical protein Ecym_2611 [Eremothecium cymbalariae DBVPG\